MTGVAFLTSPGFLWSCCECVCRQHVCTKIALTFNTMAISFTNARYLVHSGFTRWLPEFAFTLSSATSAEAFHKRESRVMRQKPLRLQAPMRVVTYALWLYNVTLRRFQETPIGRLDYLTLVCFAVSPKKFRRQCRIRRMALLTSVLTPTCSRAGSSAHCTPLQVLNIRLLGCCSSQSRCNFARNGPKGWWPSGNWHTAPLLKILWARS